MIDSGYEECKRCQKPGYLDCNGLCAGCYFAELRRISQEMKKYSSINRPQQTLRQPGFSAQDIRFLESCGIKGD